MEPKSHISHYGGIFPTRREEQHRSRVFWSLVIISQVLGVLICFVVGFWMAKYATANAERCKEAFCPFPAYPNFAYHPLFMVLAMVFLLGEGVIIHRVLRPHLNPRVRVTIHLVIMLSAFCIAVSGINAKWKTSTSHLNNPHTWIGIMAVMAMTAQLVLGFLAFYFPGSAPSVHNFYKPVHRFFGAVIFAFACTSALMGLAISDNTNTTREMNILSTTLVLAIAAYVVSIIVILVCPDIGERKPESEALLRGR